MNKSNNATLRCWTQNGKTSALIGLLRSQDTGWHNLPKPEGPRSKVVTIRTTAFINIFKKSEICLNVLYTDLRTNSVYFPNSINSVFVIDMLCFCEVRDCKSLRPVAYCYLVPPTSREADVNTSITKS
jgi:hypothetical protein